MGNKKGFMGMLRGLLLATLILSIVVTASLAETGAQAGNASKRPKLDLSCMQTAVQKRDSSIIAAFDVFHTSLSGALTARRDALSTAWGITDARQRRAAIKSAWDAFKASKDSAVKTLRNSRNDAWKQFVADGKACKTPVANDDSSTSVVDGLAV